MRLADWRRMQVLTGASGLEGDQDDTNLPSLFDLAE